MWIGRKGFRSLSGDNGGAVGGGAMEVGVVEALGETAAEEKWSDGDVGEHSCSWMLREEMWDAKEECMLS